MRSYCTVSDEAIRGNSDTVKREAISNLFGIASLLGGMAHGSADGAGIDGNALCLMAEQLHIVALTLAKVEA